MDKKRLIPFLIKIIAIIINLLEIILQGFNINNNNKDNNILKFKDNIHEIIIRIWMTQKQEIFLVVIIITL